MAPILTFAMTAAITPGPNNIILSTNAVNYGFKATIPLMLGVFFGFLSVLTLCLLGIGEIYENYPYFKNFIKIDIIQALSKADQSDWVDAKYQLSRTNVFNIQIKNAFGSSLSKKKHKIFIF